MTYQSLFPTRYGWAAVAADDDGITCVVLPTEKTRAKSRLSKATVDNGSSPMLGRLQADMIRFFEGGKADFTNYPISLKAGTAFQRRVWAQAVKIPCGKTATYGEIAEAMGNPSCARAVGQALNANPVPLLIPCHRVVSSSSLGGFSAGADLKEKMLDLEYGKGSHGVPEVRQQGHIRR